MKMVTNTIRCMFAVLLAFSVCCNCRSDSPSVSSSWAKLQISPDTLSSMEYGNFLIDIYEHANNHKATTTARDKKYFYSPLALLDSKSAVSKYNKVTKRPEMRFRIEMWNDKIQNEVVKHLNKIFGQEIQSDKVRVIPLERVFLTSNAPTEGYSLSPVWTNYDKSQFLKLSLSCHDKKICNDLTDEMRSDPEQFDHLKLLYSLSSQTSQTKQTTISIDSVTSGEMVTKLLNKFKDRKEVFLTANDEKKMLTETATNIRMDTFDDSEIESLDTESNIYKHLEDMLIVSRTTIQKQSDTMWESVFWNDDNYRPDKTTKTLNVIIKKLDTETQKKLADMFEKAEKQSEIIENLTSSNKDVEKRQENQLRRENQSKDANENEIKISRATDQELSSRNQTSNEKSSTNNVDTKTHFEGFGVNAGVKIAVENSDTENSDQENEKRELAKNYSDEQKRSLKNNERLQHNYDSNSWADVDKISSTISGKMKNDSDSSSRVKSLKEELEKLLKESRNHVEWEGEKFVPKPLQLCRINLGKFRDSQSFQGRNVRVRYTNAELSAPIKFVEHAELTVTDEWNNLRDELKATTDLLKKTVKNFETTNIELNNLKRDLNISRIDMTNKLEATTREFFKTSAKLEKTCVDSSQADNDLTAKLNATDKKMEELEVDEKNLRKELRATLHSLEAMTTNLNLTRTELSNAKDIIGDLTTQLNVTKKDLDSTKIKLEKTNFIVNDLTAKLNARTSEIVNIRKMPTSCEDLKRMGQKVGGFFPIKGSEKLEMVYCNFDYNGNQTQKWIGYADVKSTPVYFYVQRNSNFTARSIPITFDLARLNEGNAMNLTSGIFTAPRPGIYFFSFTGQADFPASTSLVGLGVSLYLNRNRIGLGLVDETNTVANQNDQVAIQSTLNLKTGDQVWLQIDSMVEITLSDDDHHHNHFIGYMLEEKIVTSL